MSNTPILDLIFSQNYQKALLQKSLEISNAAKLDGVKIKLEWVPMVSKNVFQERSRADD